MGNGVNWLKSHGFFTKPYYPYTINSLLSVKATKHITTGKNILDLTSAFDSMNITYTLEDGWYVVNNIAEQSNILYSSHIPLPALPDNKSVLFLIDGGNTVVSNLRIKTYDFNNTVLSQTPNGNPSSATISNEPIGYIGFDWSSSGKATFKVMVVNSATPPSTYEPYISHEYTLDGSRTVHRVFGIVDLGSLNFSYNSNYGFYISKESSTWGSLKPKGCENNIIANIICPLYTTMTYAQVTGGQNDMAIAQGVTYMAIANSNYTDAATFKTAMSGVYLLVELETPFDETVSNPELRGVLKLDESNNLYYYGDTCTDFTNPQVCEEGGTEEYIDGRTVEMPVGHDTIYGTDIEAVTVEFGTTVTSGVIDVTNGILTPTGDDPISVTPAYIPTFNGNNNVMSDMDGGTVEVKYYENGGA